MSNSIKLQNFINKANKIHKSKYDYSEAVYIRYDCKIEIICPIHGSFWQQPGNHLHGSGCPSCNKMKAWSLDSFIEKAGETHNNKYDYSKVIYKNYKTKVEIICPIHGSFWQEPHNHIAGSGCPECNPMKAWVLDSFIKEANKIHDNKYNYSKVQYKNYKTKVEIICPIHGSFWQRPFNHINNRNGCPKCGIIQISSIHRKSLNDFINKANKIHNYKYNYDKVDYINSETKIEIICPIHGSFWQQPGNHLHGSGCPKCASISRAENSTLPLNEVIQRAKQIHGNKYDYSRVNYIRNIDKVTIICPKHGEFQQSIFHHVNQEHGCPKCRESKGERKIRVYLDRNNFKYSYQHRFKNCKYKNTLPFDFYLPDYNICIEYDGLQHFKPIDKFGGVKSLELNKKRDFIKESFCEESNIKLLRICYKDYNNIDNILYDFIK